MTSRDRLSLDRGLIVPSFAEMGGVTEPVAHCHEGQASSQTEYLTFNGQADHISERSAGVWPLALVAFVFERSTDWELMFAALTMATLPIIVLYVFTQRHFIQGLAVGAVKG